MSETRTDTAQREASVIARIVAAHKRGAGEARDHSPALSRAMSRALSHASVPFNGLNLVIGDVRAGAGAGLSAMVDALPEHGLLAALESEENDRGLLALSSSVVDALIEVQTTGRVEDRALPPRPVTRIDEALSRDFADLFLAAFSRDGQKVESRDWPERMSYGSLVSDRKQVGLLLGEHPCHILEAEVGLGSGKRTGKIVLMMPRLARGHGAGAAGGRGASSGDWRAGLSRQLGAVRVTLEAVLLKTEMPLREVQALSAGHLIHFDHASLSNVALEGRGGQHVLTGRLGQIDGKRALKVTGMAVEAGAQVTAEPNGEAGVAADLAQASGKDFDAGRSVPGGEPALGSPGDFPQPPLEAPDLDSAMSAETGGPNPLPFELENDGPLPFPAVEGGLPPLGPVGPEE